MQKTLARYFPVFVLPTLIAFIIAFVIPFIMGLFLSFADFTTVTNFKWVGTANYVAAFTENSGFLDALWFTVKFTVVSMITINIIAFSLALLLTRKLKGTNVFRTVFFMPNLIGGIVLGYIWQIVLNGIFGLFGVTLTFSPVYGFWGLVILMNWQLIGYMMIIYIVGIQNIPGELIDAARVDGANKRGMLRYLIIPMVRPAITICTFLTLTNSFKLFDQNLTLTAGAPSQKTSMLALDIFNTFYGRQGGAGVGQAKAVIFFVLVAALCTIQLILTRRKEEEM